MGAVLKDREDRHRVRRSFVAKGIDPGPEDEYGDNANLKRKSERRGGEDKDSTAWRTQRQRTGGSSGPRHCVGGAVMKYSDDQSNSTLREKRPSHDHDDQMGDSKKGRVMCVNLAMEEINNFSREDIVNRCLRSKPNSIVLDSRIETCTSDGICQNQQLCMKYFVRIDGQCIEANSPQVIAQMITDGIARDGEARNECGKYLVRQRVHPAEAAGSLMKAMEKQLEYGEKELFLCDVQGREVDHAEREEKLEKLNNSAKKLKVHRERLWATYTTVG